MIYHESSAFDTYCLPWELLDTPPVPNGRDGAPFVDPYEPVLV